MVMDKLIIVKTGKGDFARGFPVTLQIWTETVQSREMDMELTAELPPNLEIKDHYSSWWENIFPTPTISVNRYKKQLIDGINNWLNCSQFLSQWSKLLKNFTPNDRVRVIWQTDDFDLQQFPWYLWDFFEDYDRAEVAVSSAEGERVLRKNYPTGRVKILGILGSDDGINIATDRSLIEGLPDIAPPTFLVKPERQDLNDRLWEQQMDILFFAGHSEMDQSSGLMDINDTESLSIDDLRYGLQKAIAGGLQVAIFNSCQGLGLARDLADLHLPVTIVMREPVPDRVAQEFLKYFLTAYARDRLPLYLAVREARRKLQGLETEFPGASWLPVIYQNIAARPPSWHDLQGNFAITPLPVAEPELPDGQVELASRFYVERPPIESRCYQAIARPGALIRIKAPQQMGKTSLMAKILHHASESGLQTVYLDFEMADREAFADLDRFLQWFCAYVGEELELPNQLTDAWREGLGSKVNCKRYFEKHILAKIPSPLALGLDKVDWVFPYDNIAEDFLGLLRSCHEEANRRDIWKNFRLVMAHSREVYVPMDINQSPFNVGLPVDLPEFTPPQVQDLARRYGLNWEEHQIQELMAMVGGHPYLVGMAFYYIALQDVNLEQLLAMAPTEAGLYGSHLRRHLWNLQDRPELAAAMHQVVTSSTPLRLDAALGFKLDSMGLARWQGNEVIPRCDLYRLYFGDRLS